MSHQEGVIQFHLDFTRTDEPLNAEMLREMDAWRQVLHRLELIGQHPDRYDGLGYGNISVRYTSSDFRHACVIGGTQTGHLKRLTAGHYTLVSACDIAKNRVIARGLIPPSSESMTHGVLYLLDDAIAAVIHVHSPEIWNHAVTLGIPVTSPNVLCGTPEMAAQVDTLFQNTDVTTLRIFAMGGHQDGIFTFGDSMSAAGTTLIRYLASAIAIEM
jgi:ribulose-5-phosphate 4-epimerase/fuculose-1-phosphate aldolase